MILEILVSLGGSLKKFSGEAYMLWVFWRSGRVIPRHARIAWILSPFDGRSLGFCVFMASVIGPSEGTVAAAMSLRLQSMCGYDEGGRRSGLLFGGRAM